MKNREIKWIGIVCLVLCYTGCAPILVNKTENKNVPADYNGTQDSTNSATVHWKEFFDDPYLQALVDTALQNNQELNITLQEIVISQSEVRERKGEYLPFVGIGGGAGVDKVGRYTRNGALEATTYIEPGKEFPEPLPDYMLGAQASWEVDVWKKLRNAKKSAALRYLSSIEGKNFMVTQLIAEIAGSYYELLALDNQLEILQGNIEVQETALEIVRLQKASAQVTELAVKRFEAQLLHIQSLEFEILQEIVETENRINFLVGRFPQPVPRNPDVFKNWESETVASGLPSQLLENRPDIRQAEQELAASRLNVKVAKANFYPSLDITANVGLQAFNPAHFISPESVIYSLAGEIAAPLINRNAIKALYYSANARQIQAVYDYERKVLNAYIEVVNQLSRASNLENRYVLQEKQVEALAASVGIANGLFRSARADYLEVLLTQRETLEARFELIETRKEQMLTKVSLYQVLGGGWN